MKIGNVCKCKRGIIGVVTQLPIVWYREDTLSGEVERGTDGIYRGVTLDGKAWQSKSPCLLYRTIGEYISVIKELAESDGYKDAKDEENKEIQKTENYLKRLKKFEKQSRKTIVWTVI